MNEVVGAQHEFHDEEYVTGWATRFAPTPERLALFDAILSELTRRISPTSRVVELGIGPGYLADHLLRAMPSIRYYGVDFSGPMLAIAQHRLELHSDRVAYVQADLVRDRWWTDIHGPIDAIVSTWALHDLGSKADIEVVYESCAQALRDGGMLLNGDFIKPDGAKFEYEPGRFEVAKHIAMLRRVGFESAECLAVFEEELESPTAAQNYACLRGLACERRPPESDTQRVSRT
ncbi:MAG TPA: class I SAM-dependent methyltransferase [Acidobacteriota bacterium]|nr:class I SAM-dependent methyltransferase [Acidobacteriota bacterium]